MKKRQNNSSRASALQITLSIALLFIFAILLAIAAPTDNWNAIGQNPPGLQPEGGPVLGNYPPTSIPLSTDTTVTPSAAPTGTMRITVSSSTDFKGRLEGYPATGVVRVTDAHPAGTYTVTVRAFDGGGASAITTFTLTVTTPVTCNPVDFVRTSFGTIGGLFFAVAVGDFNGDGKQDLAVPNARSTIVSVFLGDGAGSFGPATNFDVGDNPESIAVGDFNGDGMQDLAVVTYFGYVTIR